MGAPERMNKRPLIPKEDEDGEERPLKLPRYEPHSQWRRLILFVRRVFTVQRFGGVILHDENIMFAIFRQMVQYPHKCDDVFCRSAENCDKVLCHRVACVSLPFYKLMKAFLEKEGINTNVFHPRRKETRCACM